MHAATFASPPESTPQQMSAQAQLLRLGWSSSRLAHALGIHRSVVSRTLRGESRNPATQALIAMFAGLAPKDLFGDACAPSIRNLRAPKARGGRTRGEGASHAA